MVDWPNAFASCFRAKVPVFTHCIVGSWLAGGNCTIGLAHDICCEVPFPLGTGTPGPGYAALWEITSVKSLEPYRERPGRGRVLQRRGCVGPGRSRYGDLY